MKLRISMALLLMTWLVGSSASAAQQPFCRLFLSMKTRGLPIDLKIAMKYPDVLNDLLDYGSGAVAEGSNRSTAAPLPSAPSVVRTLTSLEWLMDVFRKVPQLARNLLWSDGSESAVFMNNPRQLVGEFEREIDATKSQDGRIAEGTWMMFLYAERAANSSTSGFEFRVSVPESKVEEFFQRISALGSGLPTVSVNTRYHAQGSSPVILFSNLTPGIKTTRFLLAVTNYFEENGLMTLTNRVTGLQSPPTMTPAP